MPFDFGPYFASAVQVWFVLNRPLAEMRDSQNLGHVKANQTPAGRLPCQVKSADTDAPGARAGAQRLA